MLMLLTGVCVIFLLIHIKELAGLSTVR